MVSKAALKNQARPIYQVDVNHLMPVTFAMHTIARQ